MNGGEEEKHLREFSILEKQGSEFVGLTFRPPLSRKGITANDIMKVFKSRSSSNFLDRNIFPCSELNPKDLIRFWRDI